MLIPCSKILLGEISRYVDICIHDVTSRTSNFPTPIPIKCICLVHELSKVLELFEQVNDINL